MMKSTNYKNLALAGITAAVLTACSSGGTCGTCAIPVPATGSKLIFVAPSILPSLANTTGINYMGVYNPTTTAISNISYSLGQAVGTGSSVTLDPASAKICANIAAKSSCFLKLSVPESTIAGGAVVTASNSDGTEAATPLAIGVQQVPYGESANANGVGLYFYPKAQYSESGVPFMLATAVVQSPNVGNINSIEIVDESGNLIADQYVTSGNSGVGAAPLTMGSVVEIMLPLPKGVNLSQNYKVRTSYQSAPSTLSTIAEKLGLANKQTQATSNQTTGTQVYTVTTQGNNINLQFTPSQVYLTGKNPVQYGYLYNIGDLTASQIQVSSSSPNVRVTAADQILNGQRVIKVTYELINTTVAPASNIVTVTAQNPAGQTQTSTGNTNQNVTPDVVPTPSPTPIPTPTLSPGPAPLPLTVTSSQDPVATLGGMCSTIGATLPNGSTAPVGGLQITFNLSPVDNSAYGFGAMMSSPPYVSSASCTIGVGETSCLVNSELFGLCAGGSSAGTQFAVSATTAGYAGNTAITVAPPPPTLNIFQTDTVGGYASGAGVSSFDTACADYASSNAIAGNYKALVATATRYAGGSDWVIQPDTAYQAIYSNGSGGFEYQNLFTSDGNSRPPNITLSNNIFGFTTKSSSYAWSGFQNNQFYYDPTLTSGNFQNCSNWSSISASDSNTYLYTAFASSFANWPTATASGATQPDKASRMNCAGTGSQQGGNLQLLCVQQPASITLSVTNSSPQPGIDTATSCTTVTATLSPAATNATTVNFSVPSASASSYYFSSAYGGSPVSSTSCNISASGTTCNGTLKLCAGSSAGGTTETITGTATGYASSTTNVMAPCTTCRIFTTANFNGGADLPAVASTLGLGTFTDGFQAGDQICTYNATQNNYPGTYKAMIAGSNRQPGGSDWVIHANTPYVRASDGTTSIGTSTAGAQLPDTLTNAINPSVPASAALNGFTYNSNPWVLDAVNGNCNNWTSATAGTWVTLGYADQTAVYASGMIAPVAAYLVGAVNSTPLVIGCNSVTSVLYCVQQ